MARIEESRKHGRFDTKVDLYFSFAYDFYTRVKYQLVDLYKNKVLSEKYQGVSKNVSCGGLGFYTNRKLTIGDVLKLEVYLPGLSVPIPMEGEVRWCKSNSNYLELIRKLGVGRYETGVRVISVDGTFVDQSIYYDKTYQVQWSVVLESVLGSYRKYAQRRDQI